MYKTTLFLERFCLTPCYRWRTKIVQECNILERFCVNLKRTSFSMCCSCTNIKECIKWSHHDVVLSTLWNDKQSNRTILVTIRCTRHWVVVKLILCVIKVISMNSSNGFDVVVVIITLHNFSSRSSCKLLVVTLKKIAVTNVFFSDGSNYSRRQC